MMKINSFIKYAAYAVALVLVATLSACSDDDDKVLLCSDHLMEFSYTPESKEYTVCASGDWTISSNATWIHFDKTSGVGDGSTREKITVTVDHNISGERTDSFTVTAAGQNLVTKVVQDAGHATILGTPSLSATLQVGKSAAGTNIVVPYTYGYKGQKVTITPTLSGDGASGLQAEPVTATLTGENGTINIPITGTPEGSGEITVSLMADDTSIDVTSANFNVVGAIILEQHFDLMIWGGNFITGEKGIMFSGWHTDATGKRDGTADTQSTCNPTSEAGDLLGPTCPWNEAFVKSRGLEGWSGDEVHERPGFVKLGKTSVPGVLTTPALGSMVPANGKIHLSFRAAKYPQELELGVVIDIKVEGPGTVQNPTYALQGAVSMTKNKETSTWENISTVITGATADTKITITCHNNELGKKNEKGQVYGCRYALDDIVVTQ